MRGKIIALILLVGVLLSSSVNASPIADINNQKLFSSYLYRVVVKILDSMDMEDGYSGNIVHGDADDYANGRTEEGTKEDLINRSGR